MRRNKALKFILFCLGFLNSISSSADDLAFKIKKLTLESQKNAQRIEDLKRKTLEQQKHLLAVNRQLEKQYPKMIEVKTTDKESLLAPKTYSKSSNNKQIFPILEFETADKKNSFLIKPFGEMSSDIFSDIEGLRLNNGVASPPILNRNTAIRTWLTNAGFYIESKLNNDAYMVVIPNFAKNQVFLSDAFVSIEQYKLFSMRAGYQNSLVSGLGILFRPYITYAGFTTNMAPTKETGVVWFGTLGKSCDSQFSRFNYLGFENQFSYQFGVFDGTADGVFPGLNPTIGTSSTLVYLPSSAFSSNKSFEGRLYYNPFFDQKGHVLEHFGFGVAASTQKPNAQNLMPFILTIGQNIMFGYNNEATYAVSSRTRYHPQLVWYYQQFGLYADWAQTLQNLTNTYPSPVLKPDWIITQKNKASEVQVFYNVTGEHFNTSGLIEPHHAFHIFEKGSGWGAWQLFARFSSFVADPSTYSRSKPLANGGTQYYISDPRVSVSKATGWSVGFNWFWSSQFRMRSEFAQTKFIGGCSTGALNDPVSPGCLSSIPQYVTAPGSKVINRPDEYVAMESVSLYF